MLIPHSATPWLGKSSDQCSCSLALAQWVLHSVNGGTDVVVQQPNTGGVYVLLPSVYRGSLGMLAEFLVRTLRDIKVPFQPYR